MGTDLHALLEACGTGCSLQGPTSGFWLQVGRGRGGTSGRWVVLGAEKRRAGAEEGGPQRRVAAGATEADQAMAAWLLGCPAAWGLGRNGKVSYGPRGALQGPRGLRPAWEGPAPV